MLDFRKIYLLGLIVLKRQISNASIIHSFNKLSLQCLIKTSTLVRWSSKNFHIINKIITPNNLNRWQIYKLVVLLNIQSILSIYSSKFSLKNTLLLVPPPLIILAHFSFPCSLGFFFLCWVFLFFKPRRVPYTNCIIIITNYY